ncbi:MAG: hypothetical protein COU47_01140 [Candidatus Niyogibacteria bacterium CG10_big_fil_rev_8_21_14_0_10_46_36]|uniref:SpoVR protein-like N-terminal domain-containing protein n=1 Tax=Candidatus Niyogibacteria bacterium CG10_big_fil_rev_8_21_14_0_10_46_36 TaxID=1974726 RepID=A0A2H0TDQ9_9BACT|nr:MAG: hypothetical protein COU47_01140 [Candidatus Niyogibacteria bacterium CG10_big_fil_rev_8_21_14_0_10_46_36]
MTQKEIDRLKRVEERIIEIAQEEGLQTTDTIFEVVPADRVLEGMSFHFPTNFSYWQFGRDYEKNRTIYEHTGQGIPYEQVWNFETPKALIAETNPFALKVLTIAHVMGHVDFFLANKYLQHARSVADIATEARRAARRFQTYESIYGQHAVENIMDAAEAIQWHQSPNLFANEENEKEIREYLVKLKQEQLQWKIDNPSTYAHHITAEDIQIYRREIEDLQDKTPPQPAYDLLSYIIRHASGKTLKPWMKDVLSVMRNQARHLAPNARTKTLNEGWASFWHYRIMHRLFKENVLDDKDFSVFNHYHAAVVRKSKYQMNWYSIGLALFEDIKYRWDTGRFGEEYEKCEDPYKKAKWFKDAKLGMEKIFEVRELCNDYLAIDEFFTNEFIRGNELYIYQERYDDETDTIVDEIVEDNPAIIRIILKNSLSKFIAPLIYVKDGNYKDTGDLLLVHHFKGYPFEALQYLELTPQSWRNKTMERIFRLWGRPVHLDTFHLDETPEEWILTLIRCSYGGGKNHSEEPQNTHKFKKDKKLIF